LAGSSECTTVCGKNHEWLEHSFDARPVFKVASCGIPAQGWFKTPYAIPTREDTWSLERRFVPNDRQGILLGLRRTA
jgi:hypothetical protein